MKEKASLSYKIAGRDESKISLQQSEDGCFVFDVNTSIAPRKGFVQFFYNEPHMRSLTISYQTPREHNNRRANMHATQYTTLRHLQHGEHILKLVKQEIHRLPTPYKSRCSDEGNLFSNINTATSKQETCAVNYMFQECGTVVDRWRKYAPKKSFPVSNTKYNSTQDCLQQTADIIAIKPIPNCSTQPSCNEVIFSELYQNTDIATDSDVFLEFFINSPIVTIMRETPDFSVGDLFGQLGGFIGVCCGMSFLSILELIVYTVLFAVNKISKACHSRIQCLLRRS